MSVRRSNITLVLFKTKNEQGQVHIFQDTYFERFPLHQLTIMYYFKHTHYIPNFLFQNIYTKHTHYIPNFLFQNIYTVFFRACNLHQ